MHVEGTLSRDARGKESQHTSDVPRAYVAGHYASSWQCASAGQSCESHTGAGGARAMVTDLNTVCGAAPQSGARRRHHCRATHLRATTLQHAARGGPCARACAHARPTVRHLCAHYTTPPIRQRRGGWQHGNGSYGAFRLWRGRGGIVPHIAQPMVVGLARNCDRRASIG